MVATVLQKMFAGSLARLVDPLYARLPGTPFFSFNAIPPFFAVVVQGFRLKVADTGKEQSKRVFLRCSWRAYWAKRAAPACPPARPRPGIAAGGPCASPCSWRGIRRGLPAAPTLPR